jgi:catechol 2,3-dioxygenase-like lactoylglutathione lyase family enzyme
LTGYRRARFPPSPGSRSWSTSSPRLFVRDVAWAAAFYVEKLGFSRDFLHGNPPFSGAVSRDAACLHLRLVHEPNFAALAAREGSLDPGVDRPRQCESAVRGVRRARRQVPPRLQRQAGGGLDFHVEDLDGNRIWFVTHDAPG